MPRSKRGNSVQCRKPYWKRVDKGVGTGCEWRACEDGGGGRRARRVGERARVGGWCEEEGAAALNGN